MPVSDATQDARVTAPTGVAAALVAWQLGDMAATEEACKAALQDEPNNRSATRLLGIIAHRSGRDAAALALLRTVCDDAADHSNLGLVLKALGQHEEAESAYRRAIALDPNLAAAQHNLGNLLHGQARHSEAIAAFRAAIEHCPDYATAWAGLGHSLHRLGRLTEAVEAFRSAVQCAPNNAQVHNDLGTLLFALDHNEAARAEFCQALTLDPALAMAHGNLGALLVRCGRPVAAESACRSAIALSPAEHRWQTNLGVALFAQGRLDEAEACYRQALTLRPDYATGHGDLLFALNYRCDISPEAIFAEYQEWDRRHARHLASSMQPFALDQTPGRPLRVGYVSPDFRQHAVALFIEPLLTAHNRSNVELYCYADVAAQDAATERIRMLADHWRSTLGLSDSELAEMIRSDEIDVLIDLAGHSAGNRLLAFARRSAPVQVAYLLGHGYTTGLSAMDAFLADATLAPDGAEPLFSERLMRLPRIPLAYAPPPDMPPVAPLPASTNGFVTFGYFGRPERLNDGVIACWSRILQAVPRSRLILNNRPFQEAAFRALFEARFAAYGIDPVRLVLTCTTPQSRTWAAYGDIDIALDPFPHNAGTTTIEALWQGVPVVSLAGRPTVGRFGAAIMHAVGLDDWVTDTTDGYVARAVAAAAEAIFAEYRNWDRQHALKFAPAEPRFALDRSAGRRLRVGYVSPDFRQHAVSLFAEPLLAAHDRSQVELFCYAEVAIPDTCTERFRALADTWRSTIGQSDDAVADMIRADRIDVLVDLAGHTAGSRLLVFARKPAPVQVAYLLGHGYTTGMSAMDVFLADDALVPPGAEVLFSERVMRLPRIPLAYAPPTAMPPVTDLPARNNGFVTFGHFGRPERLNDAVIAAWARIIQAIPGARLVLNSRSFQEAAFGELVTGRFARQGITRERLDLLHTEPQPHTWATYGTIDIALDPFPHNAGTTTIEALWQGVPVVSLAGRPSVGRFGATILHAVGLDGWVVDDVDAYVERAVAAASDHAALARLRAELRPRFAASPLHDAAGLARAVETTYRALWDEWRTRSPALRAAE